MSEFFLGPDDATGIIDEVHPRVLAEVQDYRAVRSGFLDKAEGSSMGPGSATPDFFLLMLASAAVGFLLWLIGWPMTGMAIAFTGMVWVFLHLLCVRAERRPLEQEQRYQSMAKDLPNPLPLELEAEARALIDRGLPVAAITRLREETGCGLGAAHRWVSQFPIGRPSSGGPCPYCGKALRTNVAKQCFECGADWHDPENVVRHNGGS